ncbi:MAG: class I adenylate-forming enzyme family protein [Acidimicrobiales bacterium]
MPTELGDGAAHGDGAPRAPRESVDRTSTVDDGRLVGGWIGAGGAADPEHVAIAFHGRTVTYRELDERSTRLALALLARGLRTGARVASVTENHPEHVVLFFACAKAGLILAPLNWRLAPDELRLQVELFDPSLVVVSATQWPRVTGDPTIASRVIVHLESLDDELVAPDTGGDLPSVDEQDGLLLIATSGTTGTPKGALLTHANCYWTNRSLDAAVPMTGDDVVLQVLPQYHVGGWNVQPLLAWWRGATVVLESTFDAPCILEVIQRYGVTTMMGVPTTYLMLAQHPAFDDADLRSLHTVVVGGAAMPRTLVDRWRERGVAVVQGYGLTEAAPNVCCLPSQEAARRPGSVGQPYRYVEVAIRDVNGDTVEGAGRGELWVRGRNVFAGYWHDSAATAAVMVDGWLDTGDVAERDCDGFYRIVGRTKEMYVSGGENVFPVEVERVLTAYEDVAEAAVVGVSDVTWGESGVAFVVPRRGADIDVAALLAHCRTHLAAFKVPRSIEVVDELPQTHIGKVNKAALRLRTNDGR